MTSKINSTLLALSVLSAPMASQAKISMTEPAVSMRRPAKPRLCEHLLNPAPTLNPRGTYVGELQELWQFPSDHLPIGMTYDDCHILSWNVLDDAYMNWVLEKDSQGLGRSMIVDEHTFIGDSKLTVRDRHVVDMVLESITHPTHPRSIIALQESGQAFLEELRSRLPDHFELINCHGETLLIDRSRFEILEAKEVRGIFAESFKTIQDIRIKRIDDGQVMRLVNVHLPGDPFGPARFQFGQYLRDTFDPDAALIAMGDMNFNELEMAEAMGQSPFSIHTPYCTNIAPFTYVSKAIDHFIVYSPNSGSIALNLPDEIMPGLAPIVSLLDPAPVR